MKTFTYNNELYIRVVPSKRLFSSTLIHEVVNRGDVFAVRVSDSSLTIVPGIADVAHTTHTLLPTELAHSKTKEVSGLELAVIGRNHFGNPIPKEWYAAAKELLGHIKEAQNDSLKPTSNQTSTNSFNSKTTTETREHLRQYVEQIRAKQRQLSCQETLVSALQSGLFD